MKSHWLGPYTIHEILGKGVHHLSNPESGDVQQSTNACWNSTSSPYQSLHPKNREEKGVVFLHSTISTRQLAAINYVKQLQVLWISETLLVFVQDERLEAEGILTKQSSRRGRNSDCHMYVAQCSFPMSKAKLKLEDFFLWMAQQCRFCLSGKRITGWWQAHMMARWGYMTAVLMATNWVQTLKTSWYASTKRQFKIALYRLQLYQYCSRPGD